MSSVNERLSERLPEQLRGQVEFGSLNIRPAGLIAASEHQRLVAESRAQIQAESPLRFHLRQWLWGASGLLAQMAFRLRR